MGENRPNKHKIYQMVTKYTNIFHCKTFQNLPKLGFFWLENIPSGSLDEKVNPKKGKK
jgi:hypothetical protein